MTSPPNENVLLFSVVSHTFLITSPPACEKSRETWKGCPKANLKANVCEPWLEEKVSSELETLYMKGIKCLLGVRSQTTNDVVLLEAGYPSLRALVKSKQKSFFEKVMKERESMLDDPLMHVIRLTWSKNAKMSGYLRSLSNCEDFVKADRCARVERVRSSAQTKSATYSAINPMFEVHSIYKNCDEVVDDYLRIAFTRFLPSPHRLRVETGRGSRVPRERRDFVSAEQEFKPSNMF